MATSINAERRLLNEQEMAAVSGSHYPALATQSAEELLAMARRLREHRDRVRGIIHGNRRTRRGKAEARSASAPDDATALRKKQIFAAALKRVNARLDRLQGEARRARHATQLRAALDRRRAARMHHPEAGASGAEGMRAKPSRRATVAIDPREVGRVSQAVKQAQARRDS